MTDVTVALFAVSDKTVDKATATEREDHLPSVSTLLQQHENPLIRNSASFCTTTAADAAAFDADRLRRLPVSRFTDL